MKYIIMLLLLLVLLSPTVLAQQYYLDWKCINSGGLSQQASTNYKAKLTIGQAVAGHCQSTTYKAYLGFWFGEADHYNEVITIATDRLPTDFQLGQNYPNPFNPSTVIEFALPRTRQVELSVFNLLGQRVTTLVDEELSPGAYRVTWDGRDLYGNEAASGVYFYRLRTEDWVETRKMTLLK